MAFSSAIYVCNPPYINFDSLTAVETKNKGLL